MRRNLVCCHSSLSRLPVNSILLCTKAIVNRGSLRVSSLAQVQLLVKLMNLFRDTRVLLCSTSSGEAFPMTETHHADSHVESIRLRSMMGSSVITDSYGESRYAKCTRRSP